MKTFLGKVYVNRSLFFRGAVIPAGSVLSCKPAEGTILQESSRAEYFDPANPVHTAALAKAAAIPKKPAKDDDEAEEKDAKKK